MSCANHFTSIYPCDCQKKKKKERKKLRKESLGGRQVVVQSLHFNNEQKEGLKLARSPIASK